MMHPGDLLVYSGAGWWSRLIRVKTFSPASHVEVFVGNNKVVGSRETWGVGLYDYRPTGLIAVLRPKSPFDFDAAMAYAQTVLGQPYDWWGLMRFMRVGRGERGKQFCSEFATNFYRAGGFSPFTDEYDADLVTPGMFLTCPDFEWVWAISKDLV